MEEFFGQVWTILTTIVDPRNLTHPEEFKKALNQPGVFWAALVAVTTIVYTETGLLIGLLLPGDSLLVVTGMVAQLSGWNPWLFIGCLIAAAVLGDSTGYWFGRKAGPAIFRRPDARIFKQKYLNQAHAFYERHGGKTIMIARFMPIVRTFVPVVAGASRMNYRVFLTYSILGSICWIMSMILFGYYLIPIADPIFQRMLGRPDFTWAKNIDLLVVVVVLVSVAPIVLKVLKQWKAGRSPVSTITMLK